MIAIRPPEYYPRLETVALMMVAETFVLADTYQYSRQSFQNRAKMRNPEGWQWVSVPLKGGQHGLPIRDVRIRHVEGWQKKHWRAFTYNYRATPFFEFYEPELRAVFDQDWEQLADLTCATMLLTHRLFDL
ncbi:MAG TPA: WbqC family protein, partial [Rhodothermales bacterium]|nr:WbqC family protein [Rhodothermales bacterium]